MQTSYFGLRSANLYYQSMCYVMLITFDPKAKKTGVQAYKVKLSEIKASLLLKGYNHSHFLILILCFLFPFLAIYSIFMNVLVLHCVLTGEFIYIYLQEKADIAYVYMGQAKSKAVINYRFCCIQKYGEQHKPTTQLVPNFVMMQPILLQESIHNCMQNVIKVLRDSIKLVM